MHDLAREFFVYLPTQHFFKITFSVNAETDQIKVCSVNILITGIHRKHFKANGQYEKRVRSQ